MVRFYKRDNKSNVTVIKTVNHLCLIIFFLTWEEPEEKMLFYPKPFFINYPILSKNIQ